MASQSSIVRRAAITAGGVIGGASALLFVADRVGLEVFNLSPEVNAETRTDYEHTIPEVIKITPTDFGSFVLVESGVEVTGHQRRVIGGGIGPFSAHKTTRTNTTKKKLRGDAELSVDNKFTNIHTTTDGQLIVSIGELVIHRPRVTDQVTDSGVALGQRINDIFTNGSNERDEVADKLVEIGTDIIGQAACVADAVKVAKRQIKEHYEWLGETFGYEPENIHVSYRDMPQAITPLQGELTDAQTEKWDLPDHLDIEVGEMSCDATVSSEWEDNTASRGRGVSED